jgi:hypothetical protein
MKTVSVIAALLIATPALAVPRGTVSDPRTGDTSQSDRYISGSANQNACFGQARASYARELGQDDLEGSNGTAISQRGGDNPEINQEFIDLYCNFEDDGE